jgi:exonuclease SbcD
VVLAIPFVHEYRLGLRTTLTSPEALAAAFRDRFADFYREQVDRARALYAEAPVIATGHLTCVGFQDGDFPVDVHRVGTIGGLPADIFDPRLQYVALGHIHRSYRVGESRAYYSGSPITLSLKEASRGRQVRIVETGDKPEDAASVRTLEVPQARQLLSVIGTAREVEEKLAALRWETPLAPMVYAKVQVEQWTPGVDEALRAAVASRGEEGPLLVQVQQVRPERTTDGPGEATPVSLKELDAEEVFRRLCGEKGEAADDALLDAFRSLVAEDSARGAA